MTPDTGETTAGALRRALRRLAIATVVLYVILIAGGIKVWVDNRHTTETLCEFRADLETRVVGSILFLREHPGGIPGISSKTIVDQITNQQRTIEALADLDCSSSTPPAVLQPLKDNGQPKQQGKANPKRPRGHIPATRQRQLALHRLHVARHRAESPSPSPVPSPSPSPSPRPRTTPGPQGPQGPQGPPGTTPTPSPSPAPAPAPAPNPTPKPEPPRRGPPPNIVERVCAITPVPIICKPLGGP